VSKEIRPHRLGRVSLLATVLLLGAGLGIACLTLPTLAETTSASEQPNQPLDLPNYDRTGEALRLSSVMTLYMPGITKDYCPSITGERYESLPVSEWQPAERPAEQHGDLNLALRGYAPTVAGLGLVDIGGSDPKAPQLVGLFDTLRSPSFAAAYRVNNWDWGCNCRGEPIEEQEVSLVELAVTPGEIIHVPDSGYDIGGGYRVLVLYASITRLTLKYTSNDSIWPGYAIHLENVCVAPDLLNRYRTLDSAGRHELPALKAGKAIGRALGDRVGVAIRDGGSFLDPRWRYDWWQGYLRAAK